MVTETRLLTTVRTTSSRSLLRLLTLCNKGVHGSYGLVSYRDPRRTLVPGVPTLGCKAKLYGRPPRPVVLMF